MGVKGGLSEGQGRPLLGRDRGLPPGRGIRWARWESGQCPHPRWPDRRPAPTDVLSVYSLLMLTLTVRFLAMQG